MFITNYTGATTAQRAPPSFCVVNTGHCCFVGKQPAQLYKRPDSHTKLL